MRRKVTVQDEANFVRTLLETDMARMRDDEDRLDYLKMVGDAVDELGEEILRRPSKPSIGELRPEVETSDVELVSQKLDLLSGIMESMRPSGANILNPVEYMRTGRCLRDEDATEYLYGKKFTHYYDHIHVTIDDKVLVLDDDNPLENYWVAPDGVVEEGDLLKVLTAMYEDYVENERG